MEDIAQKARKILQEYVPQIDKKLVEYWDGELKNDWGFNERQKNLVVDMLEHAKEHDLRTSKRLRGSFVNYGYMLSGKPIDEKVWDAAVAVELVHTALLMHDDFMDLDDTRRGKPTTHKFFETKGGEHFGHAMAVNSGDMVLCLGFELLQSCGSTLALKQMLRGVTNTVYGQAYDVTLEHLREWSEEDVIILHKAKTAIYTYQNPLYIGAYLAGIEDKNVYDILHDYAMDGGVAFQLQDDILGVYGTPEKTGKSADSDLLQGKCTLMVRRLLDTGTPEQKAVLDKVWGKRQGSREELDAAKQALMDSGAYDYNKKLAQDYARKAADHAAKLRKLNLNSEAIDYIQGVAEYMVVREV